MDHLVCVPSSARCRSGWNGRHPPLAVSDLPAPLVPADVDMRDFQFTPIFRTRLFASSFHSRSTDAEWRAGVTLWLKAWDQVPAGSLPDDDIDLCRLAELGRDQQTWQAIKAGAMRGWRRCSDGRLYHDVVAEGVLEADSKRKVAKKKGLAGAQARWTNARASQVDGSSSSAGNAPTSAPATNEDAPAIPQAMPADGKRSRSEGKRSEEINPEPPDGGLSTASTADRPQLSLVSSEVVRASACPHVEIRAAYHRILPMLPAISDWTPERAAALRNKWKSKPERQSLEWWERFFSYIGESKFLTGCADPSAGRAPFLADIDFILRPSKFVSIIEGKYHGETVEAARR